ncbi:MAG: 4Fe-4S binding protein [Bacteroidota bacterium]
MKEITILSGKGGTGKTSITAAIASLASDAVFCDNDVDAADLHLIFDPDIREEHRFLGAWVATIDESKCIGCNVCQDQCRFDAIHTNENGFPEVNPNQCEGCRLCERLCPANAISSERSDRNFWYVSDTRFGTLVHAKMGPGEENSGKLVSEVRKKAKELATENNAKYVINDGPPGIGCAAISSLTGTNQVLMIIEPTVSGLHDADRLVDLIATFSIPVFAVINKYDLNLSMTARVENYLKEKNIPLLGRIPFDRHMVEAMLEGKTIVEYNKGLETSKIIGQIWQSLAG